MQLHQNPSLKGALVENKTGPPFHTAEIAGLRTTAEPLLAHKQSGDRADLIAQELGMASTGTTIPLTELDTIDDKMIDWIQVMGSVFPNGSASLEEDSVHENPPMGTLNAAIFDAELDLSVAMSDELQLPSSAGALSRPQSMTGMMNSVLPLERPISPSDFLHKPAPSSLQQLQDHDVSQELEDMIEGVLPHTSADVHWDASQVDLNLFNHPDESDTLGCLLQECGIVKMKEDKSFHCEENGLNILPAATVQQAAPVSKPTRPQRDSVGPVRIRRERRASRKPARFKDVILDDICTEATDVVTLRVNPEEAIASKSDIAPTRRKNCCKELVSVSVNPEEAIASKSDTAPTRRNCCRELSYKEKYIRSREQNNLASKRCREKRKANLEKLTQEMKTLEERNKVLTDKVAKLTALRDDFQKFVNNFLFQKMVQKY